MGYCANDIRVRSNTAYQTVAAHFVQSSKSGGRKQRNGLHQPFSVDDPVDAFAFNIQRSSDFSGFIFPQQVVPARVWLWEPVHCGNQGTTVYPALEAMPTRKTSLPKDWQREYFLDFTKGLDYGRALRMFVSCKRDF